MDHSKRISYGRCPMCGNEVYKKGNKWFCSNYVYGCPFYLSNRIKRFDDTIELNDTDVMALLMKEPIKKVITSKNKKRYGAKLILEIRGKYINIKVNELIK